MTLPYKGFQGEKLVTKLKSCLKALLPSNAIPRVTYKGKKLGSVFPVKDKVERKFNLVYGFDPNAYESSLVRHKTRNELKTDKNSAIYKYSNTNNYNVSADDFKILATGFDKDVTERFAKLYLLGTLIY